MFYTYINNMYGCKQVYKEIIKEIRLYFKENRFNMCNTHELLEKLNNKTKWIEIS